jgi:hypothetical protein
MNLCRRFIHKVNIVLEELMNLTNSVYSQGEYCFRGVHASPVKLDIIKIIEATFGIKFFQETVVTALAFIQIGDSLLIFDYPLAPRLLK